MAQDPFAVQDRFLAHDHVAGIVERQTAKPARDPLRLDLLKGGSADEVPFVELDGEAKPGFVRVVFGMDIGPPQAIALLQSQRIEGPAAGSNDTERPARLPKGAPQVQAVLGRDVDLPAQLAHVRNAKGQSRNVADED
jgi:hypothetical protein